MRESKNESLLPHLSPPVARTMNTQHVRPGEGVAPSYRYQPEYESEDGALVASFPSVKFVGSPPPSYNPWRRW